MRVPVLEGAARFGAAAVAALTMTVPADQARRPAAPRDEVRRAGKLDKRYMERDAFNRKMRAIAGNAGEPEGEAEAEDTGPTPTSGAEEKFARRAYPASTIPAIAPQMAQRTWRSYGENKDGSHSGNNANQPFVWDLIGPTHALQPGVLSFSGAQFHMAGRVTALAITPTCTPSRCRLWMAAAGGGVWRTDNPLSPDPYWVFVSNGFDTNAIGTIDQDPSDSTGNTLYAGTGEPNASGDSEAGTGIFRTTDGGDTWTKLPGSTIFATRSISRVVVDPLNSAHLYAGVARGVRGISSVTGGTFSRTGPCDQGPDFLSCRDGPDQAPLGLFESNDGGTSFHLIWDTVVNGFPSVRGVNDVGLDPNDGNAIYAAAFQRGIWRCSPKDGCNLAAPTSAQFQQVFRPTSPLQNTDRTQFNITTVLPGTPGVSAGTRIYVVDGAIGIAFRTVNNQQVQVGFPSQVWRADGANTLTAAALLATQTATPNAVEPGPNTGPGWARKSTRTSRPASHPYRPAYNPCTGQCWYDADVYSPKGFPDIVYVLGSYQYGELHERSNGRGVLLSTTAGDPDPAIKGGNFSDLTWDDTPHAQPDQTHPDQHAIVTAPNNPFLFFEGSDGGMIRSDGMFDDASADCLKYHVNDADTLVHCQRVLSRVPHQLYDTMNKGLSTLQFQSVSLNPFKPLHNVQGGTQDNGTFDWESQLTTWDEEIYGDGGQSGYNYCDDKIRFNTFFTNFTDENFRGGQPTYWVVTSGPTFLPAPAVDVARENVSFYMPEVTDYTNCGSISQFPQFQTAAAVQQNANTFQSTTGNGPGRLGDRIGFQYLGMQHVWRTVDNGGPQDYLEANCPEFTTDGADQRCGDFKPLGDPTGRGGSTPGNLTGTQYGPDRLAGTVAAIERSPGDSVTLWAATSFGRVFVTHNVNAVNPGDVRFCRLDSIGVSDSLSSGHPLPPPRFVSSIHPDPANPNRAWLSYDGYNSNTKDQPGHVFEVTASGVGTDGCPTAAVWHDLRVEAGTADFGQGDIPITDLVRDDVNEDLYASTDFGVLRGRFVAAGTYAWTIAGSNLPMVEVPGLTIDPCSRVLYAATHGRSIWRMFLPPAITPPPAQACPRMP